MKKLLRKFISAGLALMMTIPMAVTGIAADTGTEAEKTPKFYSDAEMKDEISAVAGEIYANGGKVTDPEDEDLKIDYKNKIIYTDMQPVEIDPDGEGTKPAKAGKITVAVTTSDETPEVVSGKVAKDTAAAEILKASYKKTDGSVKLTAQKKAGKVYVHVLDIDINKELQQAICIPVVVGAASAKVAAYEDGVSVKKGTANVYDVITLTAKGTDKDGNEISGVEFTYILDEKYEDFISVRQVKNKFYITAEDLDYDKPGKPVSTKVTIMDTKSGKKLSYSLKIVDSVAKVDTCLASSSESLKTAKSTAELDYWIETVAENDITSDKLKLLVCAEGTEPSINEKNKIVYTKCSDVTAKLNKDGDLLTLSTKSDKPSCDIYAAYTDSASKETQFFRVAYVIDGAIVATSK